MKSHSFQSFQPPCAQAGIERIEPLEHFELNYARATLCRISASGHE
jgi:hypothetical protein